ncbi:exodeoxyribonuclease VII large subunit [uncultured Thiothrix sp.]|uniref:exodeoxyribonuclease VII large subunit n=1 Tax=uncultured Thiothrix sp. TaxID=223185 RepID=UPI002606B550|nr:exodeoxyribonuclease VII large subunit [uncultured Thiothrix sp.]
MTNQRLVLSVSQLNADVSQLLLQGFPALWIEGEISNLSRPSSGHLYFVLKDSQAQLRCALFRPKAFGLRIKPENGSKVLAYGRIGLYEPRGEYQFIVECMEAAGEGELQRRFEELKQRLAAAGLFAYEHKKALPRYPKCIGIITSPTGAAVQDILNVLQRRCPQILVLIYPVAVQGETAASQIVRALQQANRESLCEVLILARGGGSLEDLWAFNEAIVAEAIHASVIPVISGVGHEIDFTIADFVADVRAPTPSAAAELVSPDTEGLNKQVNTLKTQLQRCIQHTLALQTQQLHQLYQRLQRQHPLNNLQQKAQRLDELELRLQRALGLKLERMHLRLQILQQRLQWQNPEPQIQHLQAQLQQNHQLLLRLMEQKLTQQRQALGLQAARLQAYSPLATLDRGYALVLTQKQQVIKSVQQVKTGEFVQIRLQDGSLDCQVLATKLEV